MLQASTIWSWCGRVGEQRRVRPRFYCPARRMIRRRHVRRTNAVCVRKCLLFWCKREIVIWPPRKRTRSWVNTNINNIHHFPIASGRSLCVATYGLGSGFAIVISLMARIVSLMMEKNRKMWDDGLVNIYILRFYIKSRSMKITEIVIIAWIQLFLFCWFILNKNTVLY